MSNGPYNTPRGEAIADLWVTFVENPGPTPDPVLSALATLRDYARDLEETNDA